MGVGSWHPCRGGGGSGAPPSPGQIINPPKTKKKVLWGIKFFLNREPKMRGPFQVYKLFFALIPPPPSAKH